ncbi:helix-turn-helix domain-containing protein [Vagococcus xieshaowenii]|uniref:Mga helix-turn-helix domain-containing protein n=1 Tax=Vagococcus xieshaowenii TaxID=2562451 RepID=A0AAJ5EGL9_9ENTE|nr:helix-turn-helix domain-containing protein [Vagococcus xieshaowenii]QCA28822.1 hypothetical protein E4Z98_05620 [Vagococcus xieshaowenii]TFZ42977.1 hypothetical protein E4031_01025 [Vagococcus xieshaowenii]
MKTKNFLSMNKVNKLKIIQYFIKNKHKNFNINDLSQYLEIPTSTLKRHIKEINHDVSIVSEQKELIIKKNSYDYHLTELSKENGNLYTKIYREYLDNSNMFRLGLLFVKYDQLSIQLIIEELSLSKTPVYETINDLDNFLKTYGLQIEKNDIGSFKISGPELNIRIFICNLLMHAIPEETWPFNFSKSTIKNHLVRIDHLEKQSERMKSCFHQFNAIILNRIKYGNFLNFEEDKLASIPDIDFPIWKELNIINFDSYFRNEGIRKSEEITYKIMIISLFPNLFLEKDVQLMGKKLLEKPDELVTCFYTYLREATTKLELKSTSESLEFCLFHLVIHNKFARLVEGINTTHLLNLQFDTPQSLICQHQLPWKRKRYQELVEIYLPIINKKSPNLKGTLLRDDYILYINTIAMIMSLLHLPITMKAVKLHFDFGKDEISKKIVIQKIESIYQPHIYKIIETPEEADIIFCNHLYHFTTDQRIYIKDIMDFETINVISNAINSKLLSLRFKKALDYKK